MTFGETIKDLRRNANMTQEKLAEILEVSPQAVSRWETDLSRPDISMLPPLANLFSVTVDHLLGMEDYQKNLRKEGYEAAFKDYWKHDDKEENYRIAKKAVAEYPSNMEWLEWLASDEYYLSFLKDRKEAEKFLDLSVKHYKTVLENTSDRDLKDQALSGLVRALTEKGDRAKAREYAENEADEEKRDELLWICLAGKEKKALGQKLAHRKLGELLMYLNTMKSMERCDAVDLILKALFPDGNYQNYHNILEYNEIDRARLFCKEGKATEALEALGRARMHAEETDKWCRKKKWGFTAPLFDMVGGTKIPTETEKTDLDEFAECLRNNACFDIIRKKKEFQKLLKEN